MLPEWQQRLVEETEELSIKLNKLNKYMATKKFYDLSRTEKDLLYEQQRVMSQYLQILGKRCENYGLKIKIMEEM